MEIQKIIIHELMKIKGEASADTFLSNELIPVDETSEKLVKNLNNSYKNDNIVYAKFDKNEDNYFPKKFKNYSENDSDEIFLEFTRQTTINLKEIIQNINLATGGFLVYSTYTINSTTFTSVFLIRDTEGMLFNKDVDNHVFNIDKIKYMNVDKLAMGCRINHTKYFDSSGKYLSFIKHRVKDISDYFIRWISAHDAESSKDYTSTLYDIIGKLPLPLDTATGEEMTIDVFRDNVYSFITSRTDKLVNLISLSNHFYDDAQKIINFVTENELEIDTEFRAHSDTLRRFTRVYLNADGIRLNFTRGLLTEGRVKISEHNSNMVIIESESLANKMRIELDD